MVMLANARGLSVLTKSAILSLVLLVVSVSSVSAHVQDLQRGDVDLNGQLQLTDAVALLGFLFQGQSIRSCEAIQNASGTGGVDLTDAINILNFLFLGAAAPPPLSGFENRTCQEADEESIAQGEEVYRAVDPAAKNALAYSCATCHSNVAAGEDPVLRAGSTLFDAIRRPSFKAGQVDSFLGAANVCRTDWMAIPEWSDDNEDFLDLVSYLHSLTPNEPAPVYNYEIAEPQDGDPTGDVDKGCDLFHQSCFVCHGEGAAGTTAGPQIMFPELNEVFFDANAVRAKVRLSGPFESIYPGLQGGFMPFFTKEQISDEDLEDIVAYLLQLETECSE